MRRSIALRLRKERTVKSHPCILRTLAFTFVAVTLGLATAGAQSWLQPADAAPLPSPCASILDPVPSGPNQAPADQWADPVLFAPTPTTSNDYHWTHSSMPLQGNAAKQKWGACVFFNPDASLTAPVDMTDWR